MDSPERDSTDDISKVARLRAWVGKAVEKANMTDEREAEADRRTASEGLHKGDRGSFLVVSKQTTVRL